MNLNTRKKNGFTMIELIAVIVILGILAAAAVPRFLDARDDAQLAAAEGLAGAWLSECGMRVADAALNGGTSVTCPDDLNDTAWSVDTGEFTMEVSLSGTTACQLQVQDADGTPVGDQRVFNMPDGFTASLVSTGP